MNFFDDRRGLFGALSDVHGDVGGAETQPTNLRLSRQLSGTVSSVFAADFFHGAVVRRSEPGTDVRRTFFPFFFFTDVYFSNGEKFTGT